MTAPKLSPALEEALHDAAMTIYDASDCGGTLDQFKSLLRSLVLQAQRETLKRCTFVLREDPNNARDWTDDEWALADNLALMVEADFALGSGDDGEGKG